MGNKNAGGKNKELPETQKPPDINTEIAGRETGNLSENAANFQDAAECKKGNEKLKNDNGGLKVRDGRDAILSSIKNTGKQTADSIIADAESERKRQTDKAKEELEDKYRRQITKAAEEAAANLERSSMLAKLDSNKIILGSKQAVINKVYEEALTKLSNMTDNVYRDFIASFINDYAEDNDTVVICKADAKRLHYDWLNKAAAKKGFRLSFDNEFHEDRGGIILRNQGCDKNFTFSALLKEARGATESKVAKCLFGN